MRSAGAKIPSSSGYGTSSSNRGGVASRAADRRRNKRRDRARKSTAGGTAGDGGGEGGGTSREEREYRVALHMDTLEGVTAEVDGGDDDDEYDEFADLDDEDNERGGKKGGKAKRKRKRGRAGGGGGKNKSTTVAKYLKARSLASILMEEAGRADSVARRYVDANVRRLGSGNTSSTWQGVSNNNDATEVTSTTYTNPYPSRKFCPVTGLFGEYTEPKSGIPYASLAALEQIRERPPPWMSEGRGGGSANYWEAVKSLQK